MRTRKRTCEKTKLRMKTIRTKCKLNVFEYESLCYLIANSNVYMNSPSAAAQRLTRSHMNNH